MSHRLMSLPNEQMATECTNLIILVQDVDTVHNLESSALLPLRELHKVLLFFFCPSSANVSEQCVAVQQQGMCPKEKHAEMSAFCREICDGWGKNLCVNTWLKLPSDGKILLQE